MPVAVSEQESRVRRRHIKTIRSDAITAYLIHRLSPWKALGLLTAFVAVWTFYFTVTEMPVALKHDSLEAYAWGQEFQLGYHQHPPLWAWICGVWFRIFPSNLPFFAALSATNAAIGVWGVWRLTGELVAEPYQRLAARLLPLLTPLFTFYAFKFDANTAFLPLWPWTLLYFWRASERANRRATIGFGVLVGLCLMSKYYAVLPLSGCCLAACMTPNGREWLRSQQPWIAVGIALIVLSPHLWWLTQHQAPPIAYLHSKLGAPWEEVRNRALIAISGVAGMMSAVIVLTAAVATFSRDVPAQDAPLPRQNAYWVCVITLTPVILTIVCGLGMRTVVTSEMMLGVIPLMPLMLMQALTVCPPRALVRAVVAATIAVNLGAVIGAPIFLHWRVAHTRSWAKQSPFEEMALEGTRLWQSRTNAPLTFVAGSPWYDNATAFYSPFHPHSFPAHDLAQAFWVTPTRISQHGLLSICLAEDTACLAGASRYANTRTERFSITMAHRFAGYQARALRYVVVVTPPVGTATR